MAANEYKVMQDDIIERVQALQSEMLIKYPKLEGIYFLNFLAVAIGKNFVTSAAICGTGKFNSYVMLKETLHLLSELRHDAKEIQKDEKEELAKAELAKILSAAGVKNA